jgi:hypothetical protein
MHNLAVSQTQVFDVLNLENYPTGQAFAQPGRVGIFVELLPKEKGRL